jgi:hypothetical protein
MLKWSYCRTASQDSHPSQCSSLRVWCSRSFRFVSNSELVWIVREAGGSFGGEVGVMDTDSTDNQREGIDTDRCL